MRFKLFFKLVKYFKMTVNLVLSSSIIVIFIFLLIFFFLVLLFFSENPVFSILCLMCIFCLVAIFLILLGIEFLSLLFLVVYVGAISILFLFVIMMIDLKLLAVGTRKKYFLSNFILILTLFLIILFLFKNNFQFIVYIHYLNFYFIDWLNLTNFKTDIQQTGYILYNFFYFDFLISGLILFVAMIGCIALVLETNFVTKKQSLVLQMSKSSKAAHNFLLSLPKKLLAF